MNKICVCCKTLKLFSEFGKHKLGKFGLHPRCLSCRKIDRDNEKIANPEASKLYHSVRRSEGKHKKAQREWYLNNKEKVILNAKKFAKRNPEKRRIYSKKFYIENKEKCSELIKKWALENKSSKLMHRANRRAREKQCKPVWADDALILEFYKTAQGLSMVLGEWHEVDHIVPIQNKNVCGLHNQFNLQILSRSKNRSKGSRFYADA